eukprot:COSAG01_NODE_373_length_17991_cov_284.890075_4_plen_241_part_00
MGGCEPCHPAPDHFVGEWGRGWGRCSAPGRVLPAHGWMGSREALGDPSTDGWGLARRLTGALRWRGGGSWLRRPRRKTRSWLPRGPPCRRRRRPWKLRSGRSAAPRCVPGTLRLWCSPLLGAREGGGGLSTMGRAGRGGAREGGRPARARGGSERRGGGDGDAAGAGRRDPRQGALCQAACGAAPGVSHVGLAVHVGQATRACGGRAVGVPGGCGCGHFTISTDDELSRNVGESQPLLRF